MGANDPDPRLARTRAAVLDAAIEVLAEGGTTGFTVEAVVARSGVAKTTIYRRWPTKDALLLDAVACFRHTEIVPDTGTIRGDLVALLSTLAHALADEQWSRSLPSMLERSERSPELAAQHVAIVQQKTAPLAAIVARAHHRGEVRADIDTELLQATMFGALFFRRLMARCATSPAQVEAIVDTALEGLVARPKPTARPPTARSRAR